MTPEPDYQDLKLVSGDLPPALGQDPHPLCKDLFSSEMSCYGNAELLHVKHYGIL